MFPVLLATVAAVTLRLLASDLPRPLVSTSVLVSMVAVFLVLERLSPLHRAWNARPEVSDLLLVVGNRLVDVAVIAGSLALAGLMARSRAPWPTEWPLLLQAALGIFIAELIRYGLHRWSHRPGFLGRVHHTHHQPQRMYTLNGPRLHPVNQLWITMSNVVPMLLLGASLDAVILVVNLTTFFVLFQHSNVRLRFDGYNRLLATPDAHRLHHLRDNQGRRGANYGIVLLVFDALFGTYAPVKGEPEADAIGPTALRSG
ncbi:MAG TPA: sterol desaturase family protein [Polyangia bacterium]|nr:sterol desaturase family protein [Polyangia bacterium]